MSHLNDIARRYWEARFFSVALVALLIDLSTKHAATVYLGSERVVSLGDRFGLMLLYNTGGPGGANIAGPYTWHINIVVTLVSIFLITAIASEIAKFHRLGPIALGLVAGGACGNLSSMLVGPEGVADFIAVHFSSRSIVLNVADLSLWTGALLLMPVVYTLVTLISAQRRAKAVAVKPVATVA